MKRAKPPSVKRRGSPTSTSSSTIEQIDRPPELVDGAVVGVHQRAELAGNPPTSYRVWTADRGETGGVWYRSVFIDLIASRKLRPRDPGPPL